MLAGRIRQGLGRAMIDGWQQVRRSKPWRVVIRSTQAFLGGAAIVGAALGLGALGTPKVIVIPIALTGFAILWFGSLLGLVGMLVLQWRNFRDFFDAPGRVAAALRRDVFRLHAPPPLRPQGRIQSEGQDGSPTR